MNFLMLPAGADDEHLGVHDESTRQALGAFLKALGVVTPTVAAGQFVHEGLTPMTVVACLLTLAAWASLWLFQSRHDMAAACTIIYTALLCSVAGVVAAASVRSAALMIMPAAIVAAGAFLPRRSILAVAGVSLLALAALHLADNQGWMGAPHLRDGWLVWLSHSAVLVSVVVSVIHGRQRTLDAIASLQEALARARLVEAQLRSSEERFSGLFRSNPAATIVQRQKTREIVDVNEAFVRLFGHSREALLGKVPPTLWADHAEYERYRRQVDGAGRVHDLPARALHQGGQVFDVKIHAERIDQGNEQLVITMVLDVSGEVASRRALEQSEERFSKAFQFSPLGMTITRLRDGRFMEVNAANERVLGYAQADFQGRTAVEAGVWLSEKDRDDYVRALRRDGRLVGYETRMRTKSGEAVDVRIWAEIIDINGEPCALSFTLNVAEEKRREALMLNVAEGVSGETGEPFFRSLAQHLTTAIGADGVMIAELDDQRSLNTLAMLWDAALMPQATMPLERTLCERALAQPEMLLMENPQPTLMPLLPPFGEVPLRGFVGLPLRDADGTPVGLLTAVWRGEPGLHDDLQALLTIFASRCTAELVRLRRDREIRKLQDTLEQRVVARTEQLQYLNRELDSFAYTVSHDLKSPLRAIDGFTHLLHEQMEPRLQDEDRDLFGRIDASVQRMQSLITDLLALARVSQGSLQRTDVDLGALAEDVIRQERHRDPTRVVQVRIAPDLRANCDPRMAQIVLENLLGNAWKYTRQQPEATIELGAVKRPPGEAPTFYVRDNGAGFDMARADRLFKPFNRLHAASEFEGSGVGLATVRRILERHGGHIRGEGQVGQGSVFEFSFGRNTVA